jgi:hypothetical protein
MPAPTTTIGAMGGSFSTDYDTISYSGFGLAARRFRRACVFSADQEDLESETTIIISEGHGRLAPVLVFRCVSIPDDLDFQAPLRC